MPLQTLIKESMKTVTLIISSLFLFMALGVSAQQHGPQHRGQRGHMNPEEMVKKQVEQMKTELKLNEQQEKQVKDLLTENIKQRGDVTVAVVVANTSNPIYRSNHKAESFLLTRK